MNPSPDAVPEIAFDVLLWDDSQPQFECRQWPTYARKVFDFSEVLHDNYTADRQWRLSKQFSDLLRNGWEPVSSAPSHHGFLWLKTSTIWTFIKRVEWLRDGSTTSFVGHRVTPSMEDSWE